jgi:hypothetical protein
MDNREVTMNAGKICVTQRHVRLDSWKEKVDRGTATWLTADANVSANVAHEGADLRDAEAVPFSPFVVKNGSNTLRTT